MAYKCTHLEVFKRRVAWATDKQLWVVNNIVYVIQNTNTTKKIKNKAILKLKQYCMRC